MWEGGLGVWVGGVKITFPCFFTELSQHRASMCYIVGFFFKGGGGVAGPVQTTKTTSYVCGLLAVQVVMALE